MVSKSSVIFVVARPRVEIGFRRRAEAEHDARIDAALDRLQHRNAARRFRQYGLARLGETARVDQIGLVEDHDIGAGDLILEDFSQRRVVVDTAVGKTLPRDRREIRRKPAVGDRFGVGHSDHAVDRDAGSQFRPVECLQQRFRQRQPGGLDQDVVGRLRSREQRRDGRHEVIGDGAA